jgi:hypothetical protein
MQEQGALSRDQVRDLVNGLVEQRAAVVELLESAIEEVRAGQVPDPRALDAARHFGTGLEHALAWLETHGALLGEPTVLAAAVELKKLEAHDERLLVRSHRREALTRLAQAEVPARFDGDRIELLTRVTDLVDASDWKTEQETLADALQLLVRICDLHVAGDPDHQIPDIDLVARPALPQQLQRLLSAAIAGSVALPPAGDVSDAPLTRDGSEATSTVSPSMRDAEVTTDDELPIQSSESEAIKSSLAALQAVPSEEQAAAAGVAIPDVDAETALARLLEQRRYGLASWMLRAMEEPDIDVQLLRAAALGETIRTPAGMVTAAFRDIVADVGERAKDAHEPVRLVAFAAATRASLVSPASGAADLVQVLRYAVRGSTGTEAIATAIYEASSRGITYAGSAMARVKDVVEIQAEVESLAGHVAAGLDQARSRTLKYAAATDVWKTWVDGRGVIAKVMRPAAENQVEKSSTVLEQIVLLRSKGVLGKRLDDDHWRIRPNRRGRLIAGARQTLLDWADDLLEDAARWATAVSALDVARTAQGHDQWRRTADEALRAQVSRHAEVLFGALDGLALDTGGDGRLRAAAIAARASLRESFGLLRGEALTGDEVPPPEALNGELLKVSGLALGGDLEPERPPTLVELTASAGCDDWQLVFGERAAEMDHDGTRAVIDIVRRRDPILASRLESERDGARRDADRRLRANLNRVSADIERARRLGHVGDPDGLDLAAHLEDLGRRLGRDEFASVSRDLGSVERQLVDARDAARQLAEERLVAAIERAGDAVAGQQRRIRERIADGDIVTADEFIAQAETTGELIEPRPDPDGLVPWYPELAERLGRTPLSRLTAEAVASGGRWEEFDFNGVPANRRSLARRALDCWLQLRKGAGGASGASWGALQDVLALMGLSANREHRLGQRAKDHLWREVVGVNRTGSALVPHFGSVSAGVDGTRLRLLFCWTTPSPETILGWCQREGGETNTLVLYPDLLSPGTRRELANLLRRQTTKQAIAVVDDAALLWLCLAPEPPYESLMRAVLPFSAINPYNPWSTGNVPSEMFYGRKGELEEVKAPGGTSFIFGGRQFGKSALLRKAEREFGAEDNRRSAYVDVQSTEVGTRKPPEAIWEVLWKELSQRGLWSERIAGRVNAQRFAQAVRDWLASHPEGRMLLLLDECDRFLEADAQQAPPFTTVAQLKSLREETRGRFKPVFAGLHLVQRYQDVPNQPLAHLGRPISIGPLQPRDAFDLISRPMNALGYRFASDDLISRITAFCGNHPSLLQFFGEALVKYMLARPATADSPPYVIAERDVEAVIANRELLNHFRDRFRLTLELDPRYKVVADVIAHEAVERGSTVAMRADEIRGEATYWWAEGFQAMQSEDAFRSVLDEMVGLGILVSTTNGYRMRTPNVLRLLGNADEIQTRLLAAAGYQLPEPFEADSHRRPLPSGSLSPLTEKQLGDLLKPRSRPVVVLGSEATAIGRVTEAVKQGAAEARIAIHVEPVRRGGALREPATRGLYTIWLVDATEVGPQDAERAAEKAATIAGRRSVATIVLASAAHADWLVRLVQTRQTRFEFLELRRLESTGLRRMEMPAYGSPKVLETLLAKTGGWPILVDRFRQLAEGSGQSIDAIMQTIETELEDGAQLVDAVGVRRSPLLERVWATLAQLDEPGTTGELGSLLELEPDDMPVLELLRMLGALELRADGRLICEETLRRAWQRLTSP